MKGLWLTYGGKKKELTGYADADGNMAEDRHAILGTLFCFTAAQFFGPLNN